MVKLITILLITLLSFFASCKQKIIVSLFLALLLLPACSKERVKDYYEYKQYFAGMYGGLASYSYLKKDTSLVKYIYLNDAEDTVYTFQYSKGLFPGNVGIVRSYSLNKIDGIELAKFCVDSLNPFALHISLISDFKIYIDSNYNLIRVRKFLDKGHVKRIDYDFYGDTAKIKVE